MFAIASTLFERSRRQYWSQYWRLLLPLLLAPAIALVFDATTLDRSLLASYFDRTARDFPLRHDAFLENVMHTGLKLSVVAVGTAVFMSFLLSFVVLQLEQHRRRLLWTFAGITGSCLLVALLKHQSNLHCPWDLVDYGGYAPFHGLLQRLPAGIAPGRCFPGGHASAGFALMAFYFGWRDSIYAARARLALAIGLGTGMLMGWTQMMRGAHFLSHNVWSAWVVWSFLAILYHLIPPSPETSASAPPLLPAAR
jgi:membrane-associated PAP2 superfamily phosphatase